MQKQVTVRHLVRASHTPIDGEPDFIPENPIERAYRRAIAMDNL